MLSETDLQGKVAIVTGGAKRLGKTMVERLAAWGVTVAIHYGQSATAAKDLAAAIRRRGGAAQAFKADLRDPSAAAALMDSVVAALGPVDILINNAAIFPESTLGSFTAAEFEIVMRVNVLAPALLARAFAAQGRPGAIINLLDTRINDYDKDHAAYHISKRALFTLTRMMAAEYAPLVRVNAVAPGLILPPAGKDQAYLERLAHTNPLNKTGKPEDVTGAAMFLLLSDFITGQVIFVDGGRHMRGAMYG